MTLIWLRAEERENERRTALLPAGAAALIANGFALVVEQSEHRVFPGQEYRAAGATIVAAGSWRDAPKEAIILGLKELPDNGEPLRHRHIMFGHAYKGQEAGPRLLAQFKVGGGTLLDLEYLVDENARRVAAFGYWAGFAGAAISAMCYAAGVKGRICPAVTPFNSADDMAQRVKAALDTLDTRPNALIIGAKGRVGGGCRALCTSVGIETTDWDIAETAHGGPFPEILDHEIFLNAILASPEVPEFIPADAAQRERKLRVIGDVACDPNSDYNPIKVYDQVTDWHAPARRVGTDPFLDVTAIDNLPSLLPRESSEDFAAQLLPHLKTLSNTDAGVWGRAAAVFQKFTS